MTIDRERFNRELAAHLARISEIAAPLSHDAQINLTLALDDLMTLCIAPPRIATQIQSQLGEAA